MEYREFAPTQFDIKGIGLPDRQDWIVGPVSHTRDSGPLTESNWDTAIKILEDLDTPEDWEEHCFGHWGPGWFEILLLRPNTLAADTCEEIERNLEDYPILDEEDWSNREFDEACEAWNFLDMHERIKILAKHNLSIFASRRDEIPQGLPYFEDFYQSYD